MILAAAGPKYRASPFGAGDSAGNTKLNNTNRVVLRFVARKTGTLSKLFIQVKALLADGTSYTGGTVANWQWTYNFHPVLANGNFNPGTVLATGTFNPNTQMTADSAGGGHVIGVVAGFSVTKGTEYALTIQASNAAPGTDYASWNWLYTSTGTNTGCQGAQRRDERNRNVFDEFYGLDPREVVGGSSSDGSSQWYPGNNLNTPPFAKHLPCYVQLFSDGTAAGQPYYSGSPLTSGTQVTMTYHVRRPQRITHITAFLNLADSFSVAMTVNGVSKGSVTITGDGTDTGRVVAGLLPAPVDVVPADTIVLTFTPGATGSLISLFSDGTWTKLLAPMMESQDSNGVWFYSADNTRAVAVMPGPFLSAPDPLTAGATTAYLGSVGSTVSTTSGTTTVITVTRAIPAGNAVFVAGTGRNSSATLSSVADSRGNAYTVDKTVADAGSNNIVALASALNIATGLQVNDTITLTWSATVGAANLAAAFGASGVATSSALDQSATLVQATNTAAPYIVGSGYTAQASELQVGVIVRGDATTTFTAGGDQTQVAQIHTTGATNGDRTLLLMCLPLGVQVRPRSWAQASASVGYAAIVATYKGA